MFALHIVHHILKKNQFLSKKMSIDKYNFYKINKLIVYSHQLSQWNK